MSKVYFAHILSKKYLFDIDRVSDIYESLLLLKGTKIFIFLPNPIRRKKISFQLFGACQFFIFEKAR